MLSVEKPKGDSHLTQVKNALIEGQPFSFVRFSDGEIEVLKNRYLEIYSGNTVFRGRQFPNQFPTFDNKRFDPRINQSIRADLLNAAMFRNDSFLKGIPTSHNQALVDREFMLRLNGGYSPSITFSDLFINSNYVHYLEEVVPVFGRYENLYVIGNYRAKLTGIIQHGKLIDVPDNFFSTYESTLEHVMSGLENVESGSLILSSASSLSNIVGHKLFQQRQDVTFLDIGTSINDKLSLKSNTREYHVTKSGLLGRIKYAFSKDSSIKW
jgi:hypothetical protein